MGRQRGAQDCRFQRTIPWRWASIPPGLDGVKLTFVDTSRPETPCGGSRTKSARLLASLRSRKQVVGVNQRVAVPNRFLLVEVHHSPGWVRVGHIRTALVGMVRQRQPWLLEEEVGLAGVVGAAEVVTVLQEEWVAQAISTKRFGSRLLITCVKRAYCLWLPLCSAKNAAKNTPKVS